MEQSRDFGRASCSLHPFPFPYSSRCSRVTKFCKGNLSGRETTSGSFMWLWILKHEHMVIHTRTARQRSMGPQNHGSLSQFWPSYIDFYVRKKFTVAYHHNSLLLDHTTCPMLASRQTLFNPGTQRRRLKCSISTRASTISETGEGDVVNSILLKLPLKMTHVSLCWLTQVTSPCLILKAIGKYGFPMCPKGKRTGVCELP